MSGAVDPTSGWPPGWPGPPDVPEVPEVPPPFGPPRGPEAYPPVPLVFDDRQVRAELADRLLDRRTVLLGGQLDAGLATDASGRLLLLADGSDEPVELVIGCPDGDLYAAMALADTVELVDVEVRALCTGLLGGPAVLPFAVADHRIAQPHATFRFADPGLDVEGSAAHLAEASARHAELVDALHRRLAAACGRTVEEVAADSRRHRLLTAEEALAYGLVDEIARHPLRLT